MYAQQEVGLAFPRELYYNIHWKPLQLNIRNAESLNRERGNQTFWGESCFFGQVGLAFDPNPAANLVSVESARRRCRPSLEE
jgi:hypothetical protein